MVVCRLNSLTSVNLLVGGKVELKDEEFEFHRKFDSLNIYYTRWHQFSFIYKHTLPHFHWPVSSVLPFLWHWNSLMAGLLVQSILCQADKRRISLFIKNLSQTISSSFLSLMDLTMMALGRKCFVFLLFFSRTTAFSSFPPPIFFSQYDSGSQCQGCRHFTMEDNYWIFMASLGIEAITSQDHTHIISRYGNHNTIEIFVRIHAPSEE